MSGLKLVVPTSFTDTSLPILRDDPLLTAGSLALVELAHPANPFNGVPLDGAALPNIAHAEGASTLGVTDDGLAAAFAMSGLTGAKGLIQRSAKGGLHGIVSQNPGLASGDGAKVTLAPAIRAWLHAQKGHEFYLSAWVRTTRPAVSQAGMPVEFGSGSNSEQFVFFSSKGVGGPGNPEPVGTKRSTAIGDATGPYLQNIKTVAGNANTTKTLTNAGPEWGGYTATYGGALPAWRTQQPSFVFYRLYVEDLTVSKRTYQQVDALEFAEYTKQVLTTGGRYFGDTFTDPSTVA